MSSIRRLLLVGFASCLAVALAFVHFHKRIPVGTGEALSTPCDVSQFVQLSDGTKIAFTCPDDSKGKRHSSLYFLNIADGTTRKLLDAEELEISAAPVGNLLAVNAEKENKKSLLLYRVDQQYASFDIDFGWQHQWNHDGTRYYFDAGFPKDSDGFNALGVLNVPDRKLFSKPLRTVTEHLGMCSVNNSLYTENYQDYEKMRFGFEEYDSEGNFQRSATDIPAGDFSARCAFAMTFQSGHGPHDWAVYEMPSKSQVVFFHWDESGTAVQHFWPEWNPRFDNLLSMESVYSETDSKIEVLDLNRKQIIAAFKDSGKWQNAMLHKWSADGKSLIFYQNRRFTFHPVSD